MNPLLEEKIELLDKARGYECWYLVKHAVDFDKLCYLVSILKKYQDNKVTSRIEDYVTEQVEIINSEKGLSISKNYRALRVASYFGLIIQPTSQYADAKITDTFIQITELCDGNYEEIHLYNHIIQRQIEKMFISSCIDEGSGSVRENFRLYPVLLLYKILIEIGRASGEYRVTTNEYRYLIATTEKYEQFLDTLLLINLLRRDPSVDLKLETYRSKFDNRMIRALNLLSTIEVTNDAIFIKDEYVDIVAEKVFLFEKNPKCFETENYLEFLASRKSLFDLKTDSDDIIFDVTKSEYSLLKKTRVTGGENILLYGVPGSGKSHTIREKYCDEPSRIERVVFHPDYTNTDFIGQILPVVKDRVVKYEFIEGPFTRLLSKAESDPSNKYYLVVEEINRGNAPAIFGEIFQLLDRNAVGKSEYGVTNYDIAEYVYKDRSKKVHLPSNFFIVATMNTSDQNVFTLDTAFQRRWNMRLIENNIDKCDFKNTAILDTRVRWKTFNSVINKLIIDNSFGVTSSEDKRLGAYFIKEKNLKNTEDFSEKILKYLWDDVFKFSRDNVFNEECRSLEDIIKLFKSKSENDRFKVFKMDVYNSLIKQDQERGYSDNRENER